MILMIIYGMMVLSEVVRIKAQKLHKSIKKMTITCSTEALQEQLSVMFKKQDIKLIANTAPRILTQKYTMRRR